MKRVNLNMYESHYPPVDINVLWVDKDEGKNEIRAIHRYNKGKGEWEPYLASIDYMKPDGPGGEAIKIAKIDMSGYTQTPLTDEDGDYVLVNVVVPNSPFTGIINARWVLQAKLLAIQENKTVIFSVFTTATVFDVNKRYKIQIVSDESDITSNEDSVNNGALCFGYVIEEGPNE